MFGVRCRIEIPELKHALGNPLPRDVIRVVTHSVTRYVTRDVTRVMRPGYSIVGMCLHAKRIARTCWAVVYFPSIPNPHPDSTGNIIGVPSSSCCSIKCVFLTGRVFPTSLWFRLCICLWMMVLYSRPKLYLRESNPCCQYNSASPHM